LKSTHKTSVTLLPQAVVFLAESKGDSVAQEGHSPSWFKNEGLIGPPIAHTAGAVGMLFGDGAWPYPCIDGISF